MTGSDNAGTGRGPGVKVGSRPPRPSDALGISMSSAADEAVAKGGDQPGVSIGYQQATGCDGVGRSEAAVHDQHASLAVAFNRYIRPSQWPLRCCAVDYLGRVIAEHEVANAFLPGG